MNKQMAYYIKIVTIALVLIWGSIAFSQCVISDNGTGTINFPANCPFTAPLEPMYIIDGLPPGTTIELQPTFLGFHCDDPMAYCSMPLPIGQCETPGGSMGGLGHCFEGTLDLMVSGTGSLMGFNRHLAVAIFCEIHTGIRNPGDPVQTFPQMFYRLYGQLFGDPDFCTFELIGGVDFGLPSPGECTLTELPSGEFNVDSFFDITYQIQFEGCGGSILEGLMGATTATVRIQQGTGLVVGACCAPNGSCSIVTEVACDDISGTYLGDDTECLGDDDGDGYDDLCFPQGTCLAPENGTGTVDLPAFCDFTAPLEPMYIIDGLPPGTTIELQPILMDFICGQHPTCSMPLLPGQCEMLGGSMGGHGHCFEATLDLTVSGTGSLEGFNRHLAVPVMCEVHTAPRNPGDPVQTFDANFYRLSGELFGDPDFCTLRITAGTDNGLPSPGGFTLTDLGSGLYNIDSFFDITYQIEFEGCPASVLEDYMGTTTAAIYIQQGSAEPPATGACCKPNGTCAIITETNCDNIGGTYFGDGIGCSGDGDGDGYDDLCFPQGTCLAPDNGTGTVDLPADCDFTAPLGPMYIIDGLPPGTTVELEPILMDFICFEMMFCSSLPPTGECETTGGSLGGNLHCFESTLDLTVTGTGELAGFNRHLAVPIMCEVHTGPRNPGDPEQTFPAIMFNFQGELFGDPDFCTLRITAGNDNGLPSPGGFTLTELGGGLYNIDSFFDITYQIEFEGCPASVLEDYMGTTMATIRLEQGSGEVVLPPTGACCDLDGSCSIVTEAYCTGIGGTYYGTDTECLGDDDGDGYDDLCFPQGTCLAPENGTGTVDLPADCDFTAPLEAMYITEGLPPGTTIELQPILMDFICEQPHAQCSMPLTPGDCEMLGGSLGGHGHCFEATLDLTVTGTGELAGFNRHLAVPMMCEVHTGPRNPGDPVQTFAADFYRLSGELFGDPDFCTFRIVGGTDYGLPSPGSFTLTDLGSGLYNVDSFFDIIYQIEFEGCPASVLEDYIGTTTGTVLMKQGSGEIVLPPTGACCGYNGSCMVTTEANCNLFGGFYDGDDTDCLGDGDGDGYDDQCFPQGTCLAPDNGTGTIDLPADCPFTAPDETMYIIEGLPPGTTIELEPVLMDFICDEPHAVCSLPLTPGNCEMPGGTLGGHGHCFEATLDLTVTGTGELTGFSRHLAVPMMCEVHTGPRNPGDQVQIFPAVFFRLSGELFGDPDFCTFRVTGGNDYGLPGPGEFTLTELPNGDFNVDSFFDITYQIQFEGCPDSPLADYAGVTTATIRIKQGAEMQSVGYEYLPGDVNMSGGTWPPAATGPDVTYLVNYFRGASTSHSCLLGGFWCSADANGDCNIIGSDVTKLVNVFRGIGSVLYCGNEPTDPGDYPPAWPTPADVPGVAPPGWPNCE